MNCTQVRLVAGSCSSSDPSWLNGPSLEAVEWNYLAVCCGGRPMVGNDRATMALDRAKSQQNVPKPLRTANTVKVPRRWAGM